MCFWQLRRATPACRSNRPAPPCTPLRPPRFDAKRLHEWPLVRALRCPTAQASQERLDACAKEVVEAAAAAAKKDRELQRAKGEEGGWQEWSG